MTGPNAPDRVMAAVPPCPIKAQGGEGPPLVLIHGFGSDRLSWVANLPALLPVATVLAVDLPGHGAAGPAVGDGSIETLAAAVEAALDQRGVSRVTLVGHSLGGGIALLIAAHRPELVDALVLIAPVGLGRGIEPAFLRDYPLMREAGEIEAVLRCLVTQPRLINRQLVALVQKQLAVPGSREALASVAGGIGRATPALHAAIGEVVRRDLPRLLIWGEADRINPGDGEALEAFGGETCLVPEVGHLPQVEAATVVNDAMTAFLRRTVHP